MFLLVFFSRDNQFGQDISLFNIAYISLKGIHGEHYKLSNIVLSLPLWLIFQNHSPRYNLYGGIGNFWKLLLHLLTVNGEQKLLSFLAALAFYSKWIDVLLKSVRERDLAPEDINL